MGEKSLSNLTCFDARLKIFVMMTTTETITPQKVLNMARSLPLTEQYWLRQQLNHFLPETLPESATLEKAIELYLSDKCSLGWAAELAGITRWEIMDILSERGIPTNGGHEFTTDEIETMQNVFEVRYGSRK
jgi:predicted HTH domain antitoxin